METNVGLVETFDSYQTTPDSTSRQSSVARYTVPLIMVVALLGAVVLVVWMVYIWMDGGFAPESQAGRKQIDPHREVRDPGRFKWCSSCCSERSCKAADEEQPITTVPPEDIYDPIPPKYSFYNLTLRVEFFPFMTYPKSFSSVAEYYIEANENMHLPDIQFRISRHLEFQEVYMIDDNGNHIPLTIKDKEPFKYLDPGSNNPEQKIFRIFFRFSGRVYEYDPKRQYHGYIFRELRKKNIRRKLPIEYIITAETYPQSVMRILPELFTETLIRLFEVSIVHHQDLVVGTPLVIPDVHYQLDNERKVAKYTYYTTPIEYVMFFQATLKDCDFFKDYNFRVYIPLGDKCDYQFGHIYDYVKSKLSEEYVHEQPRPHYPLAIMLDESPAFIDRIQFHPHIMIFPAAINFNLSLVSLHFHFNVYHRLVLFRVTIGRTDYAQYGWRDHWYLDMICRFISVELFIDDNPSEFGILFYFRDRVLKGDLWGDDTYGHLPAINDLIDTTEFHDLMRWKLFFICAQFFKYYNPEYPEFKVTEELLKTLRPYIALEESLGTPLNGLFDKSINQLYVWFTHRGSMVVKYHNSTNGTVFATARMHCRFVAGMRACKTHSDDFFMTVRHDTSSAIYKTYVPFERFEQPTYVGDITGEKPYFFYRQPPPYIMLFPENWYDVPHDSDWQLYNKLQLYSDLVLTIQEGYHGPYEAINFKILQDFCAYLQSFLTTRLKDKPRFFNAMNFFVYCTIPPNIADHMQGIMLQEDSGAVVI